MSEPSDSKSGQSLQRKSSGYLNGSIQVESIKEPAKDIIEINNGQLTPDMEKPDTMGKQTAVLGKEYGTSEQSPATSATVAHCSPSPSRTDCAKSSDESAVKSSSGPAQIKQVLTLSPDVVENARLLIKTNGPRCIVQEATVEQLGFKLVTAQLSTSFYTSFYRAHFQGKTLILKKLLVSKLSKHNRDLLFNQGVKVMRSMCCANGSGTHFRYFVQIYEIFLLKTGTPLEDEGVLYIFMEELLNRTINNRLNRVAKVKLKYIKRWAIQLSLAISFMQERAVAHRALRLEHILLDCDENIRITSWTRAVVGIDLISGCPSTQPKEPRARRKNHLPPEVFLARYEPLTVDFWSLGVCLTVLVTKKFPFDPEEMSITFQNQWAQFYTVHQNLIPQDIIRILNLIFIFTETRKCDMHIRQAEVLELLNASAMETETDEHASQEENLPTSSQFADIIEDPKSVSDSEDSFTSK